MKLKILLIGGILCIPPMHANAEPCMEGPACMPDDPDVIQVPVSSCSPGTAYSSSGSCIEGIETGRLYYVYNCSCPSGYTERTANISTCDNRTHVISCVCQCNNCNSDTSWSAYNTKYQRRINRSCDCSSGTATCKTTYSYQCAPGYYGSSTNGTSGCTQCPSWSGIYTTSAKTTLANGTSVAGATAITGCYVVSGTYYDATGTFKTTSNYQYKG